jgi:hypothetical protein
VSLDFAYQMMVPRATPPETTTIIAAAMSTAVLEIVLGAVLGSCMMGSGRDLSRLSARAASS